MAQYKLSYFNLRALGEPMRFMFALKHVDFEDNRMEHEDWPKHKAEYPWGTLPVLQHGDIVIGQSGAIQRYLAKKFDLNGANEVEHIKSDEIVEVITDLRQKFFAAHFYDGDAAKKEQMIKVVGEETLPTYLKKLDDILAANGDFIVGKQVTYADLNVASYIEIFAEGHPGLLDAYSHIKAHQAKIFGLDGIKEWIAKRPATQV